MGATMLGWDIDWKTVTTILITAGASALFSGLLVSALQKLWLDRSLEQFRKDLELNFLTRQERWKRKAETYSKIIAQLVDLQYDYKQSSKALEVYMYMEESQRLDEQAIEQRLHDSYVQAQELLEKTIAAGAYIVSENALTTLGKLHQELTRKPPSRSPYPSEEDILVEYDRRCKALGVAIEKMTEHEKVDLRVD
jgi:hypothetical protein